MINARKATYRELDTVYGVEDLHDMLELIIVEAHNARVLDAYRRKLEDR